MNARELPPGCIVGGGYTISARLGTTPWATTYAGLAAPRRDVAIKVYDPVVGERPDVIAALERADVATSGLPAHLVLHVIAGGRDPGTGFFYRVTPLSVHPSLAQLTELCPLSVDEVGAFVVNVARVLELGHQRGLVHGALNANNVFVGPAPEHVVQIGDFGASAYSQGSAWSSPEQLAGAPPTPAADVFGLAQLAFYALTRAVYRVQKGGSDPSPSAQAREAGVDLPAPMDQALARAFALAPASRFGTVSEFAEALRGTSNSPSPSERMPVAATNIAFAPTVEVDVLPLSPRPSKRAWIAIGVASAVFVAGSALALAVLSRPRVVITPARTEAPAPSPSPSIAAAPPVATAATSTAPAPSSAPSPAASSVEPEPVTNAGDTSITVECDPTCEFVMIDGKRVKTFPHPVTPGSHGVGVSRRGFFGDWRRMVIKKGEHETVRFRLLTDGKKRR